MTRALIYLRQPTSLIALGVVIGTSLAAWFGLLPESASLSLLAAVLPLLASDTSGMLSRVAADRDALAAVVHALATHSDIGPVAARIVADTLPGGTLVATTASALSVPDLTLPQPDTGVTKGGQGLLPFLVLGMLATGLTACGEDPQQARQQAVYALGGAYDVAARMAVTYETSPAADPVVVGQIKAAFVLAHDRLAPLQDSAAKGDPLEEARVLAAQDALTALRQCLEEKAR